MAKMTIIDQLTGEKKVYDFSPPDAWFDDAGSRRVPIPAIACITGDWVAPTATGSYFGTGSVVDPRQFDQKQRTLLGIMKRHRFTGKEKPGEILAMLGGEGFDVTVNSEFAVRVGIAVMKQFYPSDWKEIPLRGKRVAAQPEKELYLRVLKGITSAPVDRENPEDLLTLTAPIEFELARRLGLLIKYPIGDPSGEVCAVTDHIFVDLAMIVRVVGNRNWQRTIGQPGELTVDVEKWERKNTDDLIGFFPPIMAPLPGPGDLLEAWALAVAVGCPTRLWSEEVNVFQGAHDRRRMMTEGSVPFDVIGDLDAVVGDYGNHPISDVMEMLAQAAQLSWNLGEDTLSGKWFPYGFTDATPFLQLHKKWLKAGWRKSDRQRDRRYAEMRRGRQLDSRYLDGELEMGKGNYGLQEMGRVICYRRTAAGDWVVDPAIMTWEAFEALPPAMRAERHAVRGAALGALNAPDAAKRDVLRLTGFLTDLLFAADGFAARAFLRDPKPLERLAAESSLLNDALPPEVAADFRACCGMLAQMAKPLDDRARLAETNLVGFAETQGLGLDVSGHPFSAWLEKQGERTPRGILIPGSDLDRLLRSSCAHAAYIVRVWAVTLAKVYIPRSIPADVSRFMSEFRKTDALGNRILTELRQPGYQHRFDEVADWFEGELHQVTKRWWKDVWQWVRDLKIGDVGITATSTDPDFGSTIAIVDSPSGHRQARRIENGSSRVLSPGPWLRSFLVGLFAAYAAATMAGAYAKAATGTALGLGFFVGLQALIIWRLLEGYIGYRILWRRFRLSFIKTMTGEAEVSIFTVGTWILPVFLFLLPPATVLLMGMVQLAAPGMPCQDTRNWGCTLAFREVLGHTGSAFIASFLLMIVGSYFYKRILAAARYHMFHNIKEPGQHLNFLFTRDSRPLYGWELEQRVFRVVLVIYIITVSVPVLFALYASRVLAIFTLANMWSNGW